MPHTYTQDECPYATWLPLESMRITREDEAIVFDVITRVAHRCRLCGRRFTAEMIPGDYTLGGHPDKAVSRGHDGHPSLSMAEAKAYVERQCKPTTRTRAAVDATAPRCVPRRSGFGTSKTRPP
jgi:hypothetical protein